MEHIIHHLRVLNIFSISLIWLLILRKCDKVLNVEDFNTEISEQQIESFLYMHELSNLVKQKTFFKICKIQVA